MNPINYLPPEWIRDAVCASTDPELFFPGRGSNSRAAKQICASCPVRLECLEYALDFETRYDTAPPEGVYGGLSARERMELIAKRRKAAA